MNTEPSARPHVVALVGPTASGKTAAAVAAARRVPLEVISADSRQVRREMPIGTAAPTRAERAAVPHHCVGIVAPDGPYSLTDWLSDARAAIEDVSRRDRLPLVVGGTGQYVWALLEGWHVPEVAPDLAARMALEAQAHADGAETLHTRLAALDPASAARIDPRNIRRVARALEIVERTGAPVPPLLRTPPPFSWRVVGLRWERGALHRRADARVEAMFAAGLVEETRLLVERHGDGFPALSSLGYREALGVLRGTWDTAEAIRRTQVATHRLVRMQAAWFASDDARIEWVDAERADAVTDAVERAARPPVP